MTAMVELVTAVTGVAVGIGAARLLLGGILSFTFGRLPRERA